MRGSFQQFESPPYKHSDNIYFISGCILDFCSVLMRTNSLGRVHRFLVGILIYILFDNRRYSEVTLT